VSERRKDMNDARSPNSQDGIVMDGLVKKHGNVTAVNGLSLAIKRG
jgi:hypothetical protein